MNANVYRVSMKRRIGHIISSITIEVTAASEVEAASLAESLMIGWEFLSVMPA